MGNEGIDKLNALIKDIHVAMLTTVSEDGSLHSRPMATQGGAADGELWFFTSTKTHKVPEIEEDHHVSVAYCAPEKSRFVSVAGIATLVQDREKARELWTPILKAWFPEGLETPDLALLRVRITSAEYWDAPSSKVVKLFGMAKAVLTGERYEPGENDRLLLQDEPTPRLQ